MTKRLKLESGGFYGKVAQYLKTPLSTLNLAVEFERDSNLTNFCLNLRPNYHRRLQVKCSSARSYSAHIFLSKRRHRAWVIGFTYSYSPGLYRKSDKEIGAIDYLISMQRSAYVSASNRVVAF